MLEQIKALGCSNDACIMMAYQTYLELTTVEQYANVTCHYDEELDIIYLEAKKDEVQSTFVPVCSSSTISLTWMRTVQNKLCNNEPKSFILIIRDSDSSSVRYKFTEGLVLPPVSSNRLMRKGSEESNLQKRKKPKL